jgi:hypothetical protein
VGDVDELDISVLVATAEELVYMGDIVEFVAITVLLVEVVSEGGKG